MNDDQIIQWWSWVRSQGYEEDIAQKLAEWLLDQRAKGRSPSDYIIAMQVSNLARQHDFPHQHTVNGKRVRWQPEIPSGLCED